MAITVDDFFRGPVAQLSIDRMFKRFCQERRLKPARIGAEWKKTAYRYSEQGKAAFNKWLIGHHGQAHAKMVIDDMWPKGVPVREMAPRQHGIWDAFLGETRWNPSAAKPLPGMLDIEHRKATKAPNFDIGDFNLAEAEVMAQCALDEVVDTLEAIRREPDVLVALLKERLPFMRVKGSWIEPH